MRQPCWRLRHALLFVAALTGTTLARNDDPETLTGDVLSTAALGPVVVESWELVAARDAVAPRTSFDRRRREGAQGEWFVPAIHRTSTPRSGAHHVVNKWGDTRMGIGFGRIVDVQGAWFMVYEDAAITTDVLYAVGYRGGVEVARSEWLEGLGEQPVWFEMALSGVDRLELVARARPNGYAYFGMDDLTFRPWPSSTGDSIAEVVVGFDELEYEQGLTATRYAGLDWEVGTGEFSVDADVVHPPLTRPDGSPPFFGGEHQTYGGGGTAPTLRSSFIGPGLNDGAGTNFVPPDTCGAIGPAHFVAVVNSNISIYDRSSGQRLVNQTLAGFLGSSSGDPRVSFDTTSQRFVVLATNFANRINIAISNTSDPTGTWTKTFFDPGQGADAGDWPDYPTLGVNKDFIATCVYMVGGSATMSCFAIDKNALIGGTFIVTAFRNLPWEGAIQPAVTWDATAPLYLVSRKTAGLHLRRLNAPAGAPTLTDLGTAATTTGSPPPNAPQLVGPPLDTLDGRLMNAFFVNGSLWTTNCIDSSGRAACKWYELDVASVSVPQTGTVDDPSLHYFAPSIAVNANDEVAMGFSGSSASQFAAACFTGRLATDAPGQMGAPVQYKAGEGPYDDGNGPRWGDYSLTSLDPTDDLTLWTIQEYARANNRWGTYVAELGFGDVGGCDVANYCFTSINSVGSGSLITHTGSVSVASNDFGLYCYGNPPGQSGAFFMGPNETVSFFGNGVMCIAGGITRYPVVPSDGLGVAAYAVDNTLPPALGKIVAGSTWKWQYWYRDQQGGGAAFNLSDALSVTYCP